MPRADEFQQVTDGLFFWQAYDPAVKVELSCCARRTARGLVFIDPIPLAREALAELCDIAVPATIILTNGNHARAAAEYRTRFSIPIFAHAGAVADAGFMRFSGLLAWLAWLFIHLIFLVGFRNKLMVLISWAYAYVTYGRGARLITARQWGSKGGES